MVEAPKRWSSAATDMTVTVSVCVSEPEWDRDALVTGLLPDGVIRWQHGIGGRDKAKLAVEKM